MSETEANKERVRRWFAAFPQLTDSVYAELVHPDIVNHPAPPPLRRGVANFRRVMDYVLAAAPDQTYRIEELVAEGDLVAARTRWSGAFTGAYLGVQGNGRAFDVGQHHSFRLENGLLAEHWAVRDDLEVFRQAGVAPPEAHE